MGRADAWVGFRECWSPDIPWIRRKKQLEMVEAKHAKQAEGLRQVRVELGFEGECRFRVWVEPGQVQDGEGLLSQVSSGPPTSQGVQRTEEAWASFQEQSGVLQVRPSVPRAAHLRLHCGFHSSTPRAAPLPPRPTPPPRSPLRVLAPYSLPLQELQGKVMEAAAALDASRGGPEL